MFNLKTATMSIQKAAALQGITSGMWSPITDHKPGPEQKLAEVSDGRKTIIITAGDVEYVSRLTWKEIR